MCHHSLPSIITPIKNKSKLSWLVAIDFTTIFMAYSVLCITAVVAFGNNPNPTCIFESGPACALQAIYTLNFESYHIRPIAVFLSLFPVFTLSTNFPLIAITLRNNLMQLITYKENTEYQMLRRILFSLLSTLPPIIISFATNRVDILVSVTGAYPGLAIMFIIPAFLVVASRKKIDQLNLKEVNPYQSNFAHKVWIYCVSQR